MRRRLKIKIRGSATSWYYFIVTAANGRTIAQSETYNRKRDALATAELLVAGLRDALTLDESADAPVPADRRARAARRKR